jgi:phenylpropionate dioxygenase-like ring-hydroxylating dioxygenase large terminal subunit
MNNRTVNREDGRAYGRAQATADEELTRVGAGTPGGELLRRYWQPVALSKDLGSLPQQVRILGEELILYRDKRGVPGLLYPRCMHRGSSLLYGKIEDHGIRCCYHGWLFNAEGELLETPCEPDSPARGRVRQPWYPLQEHFGIVFTYMGPPEHQPVFPVFSIAENLRDDEELKAFRITTGANGGHPKIAGRADYNWWQMFDNFMDPFHVVSLHSAINGVQFTANLGILPEVRFERTPDGVISIQKRKLADGTVHQRVSQVILPNMNGTPGVTDEDLGPAFLGWTVAETDTCFVQYLLTRGRRGENQMGSFARIGMLKDDWGPQHGRPFTEWSLEDHQTWQTDYVAQKSQGDISLHSEEHLVAGDKGTALMRRLFLEQARRVAQGEVPIGVGNGEAYRVQIRAGNALLDGQGQVIAGYASVT